MRIDLSHLVDDQVLNFPGRSVRVIGIDLGTTNSAVAEIVVAPGNPEIQAARCLDIVQETTQGIKTSVLVPSMVAITNGKVWIGEGAKILRSNPQARLEPFRSIFAECKNDMGLRRTYHRADASFRSARAISSHILRFLHDKALADSDIPVAKVVVTVPASFQAAQRQDTVAAAQRAGLEVSGGQLLDEPVSAFLDFLIHHPDRITDAGALPLERESRNLVVFDFGGGTCDVAVMRLARSEAGRLTVMPLTVSRYHRLGGGDIDRAIVHEILIPELQSQNGLDEFAFTFEEKRNLLQPVLLTLAESLKEKMSAEIARRKKLGRWETTNEDELVQKYPGATEIPWKGKTLTLTSPRMSASRFREILAPFLDRDLLFPREDEYRITCSIFAPLQSALDRCELRSDEVNLCLLAGGSSLIPYVKDAIEDFFPEASVLTYRNWSESQTAIAKGAALHALGLLLTGRGFLQTVSHDRISFQTKAGPVTLVPKGVPLPYPDGDEFARRSDFRTPRGARKGSVEVRVAVLATDENRQLFEGVWKIPAPVRQGEPLTLEYRYDENQVLHLRMRRDENPEHGFEAELENPLTHVVNPNATRARIDELEEELRTKRVASEEVSGKLEELADLYRQLGQNERALSFYQRVLGLLGEPEATLLNRMAFCARDLGDRNRAEKFFREAAQGQDWSGTYFNWSLARERWGDVDGALDLVKKAIELDFDPAYLILSARLHQRLGNERERDRLLEEAMPRFGAVSGLAIFHLHWLRVGAATIGDEELLREAEREMQKRSASGGRLLESQGDLPDLQGSEVEE